MKHLDEYYKTCPFPKSMGEPRSKKKKLYNGYKDKTSRRCWYTGKMGAVRGEAHRDRDQRRAGQRALDRAYG